MSVPFRLLLCWAVWVTACFGCAPHKPGTPPVLTSDSDVLVQFSLLAALAADDYTGTVPLSDVLAAGDFGVGTFDRLDGELILLDGRMFQALSDGTVQPGDLSGTTPFAAVTTFAADGRIDDLSCAALDELDSQLDRKLPHRNLPYALRIDGKFSTVTVRSVPKQSPPFRPLVEVVKEQPTWEHHDIQGTLIGVRCPQWMRTINVSGYHWHFLSDDRKVGGHVLGCEFSDGTLEYDECTSVLIRLPQTAEFDNFDASTVTEADIDKIERQRLEPAASN